VLYEKYFSVLKYVEVYGSIQKFMALESKKIDRKIINIQRMRLRYMKKYPSQKISDNKYFIFIRLDLVISDCHLNVYK